MGKLFKSKMNEYNALRLQYIKKRNSEKHDIINMEHFRVESMLAVFQKIIKHQRTQTEEESALQQLQNDIVSHTELITAKEVISNFVHFNVEQHGEWKPPKEIQGGLDIEYRDMFHSIEDAMSITLDINPNGKVPLILPLLCQRIRDLDGFKTEGIFRKSPNKQRMIEIKKRLQGKNFQLKDEDDVHIFAALLKEWLRGLTDLIIPKTYYDYCCSMAMENKLNRQQFEVFYSQLPGANRETLKYLIKFLKDLLQQKYQEHTKMNIENIAIVFGPTLLMPPHQLEPEVALKNAKSEKEFVISLIENS